VSVLGDTMTQSSEQPGFLDAGAVAIPDYPAASYFADDCLPPADAPALSASLASDFRKHGPARAMWRAKQDKAGAVKSNLMFGSVAHSVILRQAGWQDEIAVLPEGYRDYRNPAAREWRDAQIRSGKLPIKQSEFDEVLSMRDAWTSSELAGLLTCDGRAEFSIFWRCPETFCTLKARWDFLPGESYLRAGYAALDYKTTDSLTDWPRKTMMNFDLRLRAALYYESLLAWLGEPANIAYAVQEKKPPYDIQVFHLALREGAAKPEHVEFIEAGREQLRQVKGQFRACRQANRWPKRRELVSFPVDTGLVARLRNRPAVAVSDKEFVEI